MGTTPCTTKRAQKLFSWFRQLSLSLSLSFLAKIHTDNPEKKQRLFITKDSDSRKKHCSYLTGGPGPYPVGHLIAPPTDFTPTLYFKLQVKCFLEPGFYLLECALRRLCGNMPHFPPVNPTHKSPPPQKQALAFARPWPRVVRRHAFPHVKSSFELPRGQARV